MDLVGGTQSNIIKYNKTVHRFIYIISLILLVLILGPWTGIICVSYKELAHAGGEEEMGGWDIIKGRAKTQSKDNRV